MTRRDDAYARVSLVTHDRRNQNILQRRGIRRVQDVYNGRPRVVRTQRDTRVRLRMSYVCTSERNEQNRIWTIRPSEVRPPETTAAFRARAGGKNKRTRNGYGSAHGEPRHTRVCPGPAEVINSRRPRNTPRRRVPVLSSRRNRYVVRTT